MGIRRQAQQFHPQQRSLFQVKRTADFLIDISGDIRLAGRERTGIDSQRERCRRVDDLHRPLAVLAKGRTQHFVTCAQGLEAAPQRLDIQGSLKPQGGRDIVGGTTLFRSIL